VPYSRQRLPVLDVLAAAARQYPIQGLLEVGGAPNLSTAQP
jgi:hypothetical protein